MVLHRFHSTLGKYFLCEASYGDVIELVKHAYEDFPA